MLQFAGRELAEPVAPVPADMDGHVLLEAFDPEYAAAFPVRRTAAAGDGAGATVDYTEEGEKEIMQRLEGLGYLG